MTLGRTPRGKFVFQKVSKIRWRPQPAGRHTGAHLLTGSWDDEVKYAFAINGHRWTLEVVNESKSDSTNA